MNTLPSPWQLKTRLPTPERTLSFVDKTRSEIRRILQGQDSRLLIVVGPCSIHDLEATLDYATRLQTISHQLQNHLLLVMRVYCQKPRSHYGWKGLINDPYCNGSFDLNAGLYKARKLMLDINQLGLPIATEWLDPFAFPYLEDLASWAAIGARTSESQIHRELASYCTMPLGFKNNPDGNLRVAIDGMRSASKSHVFMGLNPIGKVAPLHSTGNPYTHLILRGSKTKANYFLSDIKQARLLLNQYNLAPRVMIDCSHGNSSKDPLKQGEVVHYITHHLFSQASPLILGLMLESFLLPGHQHIDHKPLRYGQSITDACLSWPQTEALLHQLAEGWQSRQLTEHTEEVAT